MDNSHKLLTAAAEYRRGEHFRLKAKAAGAEVQALKVELRATRARRFAEGSAVMLAAVHDALGDLDLSLWISQKLRAQRTRLPPFRLPPEKEAMVRAEVADLLRRSGIKNFNVQDIEI